MSGRLLLCLALAVGAGCAEAQSPSAPCTIVYGHGRNLGDARENEAWNRINAQFNEQVVARLQAAGQRALPMLVGVDALAAPQAAVARLLAVAEAQGCRRIVDTAVFANESASALVLRLRVHPVLASLGPRLAAAQPVIGEALYTSQRDFDLGRLQRGLEPARLEALAREMVEAYLAGDGGLSPAGR